MGIHLPETYEPEEWRSLTDHEREQSQHLYDAYRLDPERIVARLQAIGDEAKGYKQPILNAEERKDYQTLRVEYQELQRLLSSMHDEGLV